MSAGLVIYEVLSEDDRIKGKVKKIFPIMTDSAALPYIAYRRTGFVATKVKNGTLHKGTVEVLVMAASYPEGVELAEYVREDLDGRQVWGDNGLHLNSCTLIDAHETWAEDAFVQSLTFEIEVY